MKTKLNILLLLIIGFSFNSLFGEIEPMTGKGLEEIIREFSEGEAVVNNNVIEFRYGGLILYCIYDEGHNRMRIISRIKDYFEVTEEEKDRMMISNFHSALDARYGVSNGELYSAYIHPLNSLTKADVVSGIYQVASLNLSFGVEYSSGLLSFGGEEEQSDGPI
ncbi:MAG: hypothetical protein AAF546_12945 [Verrucomicrobiota bacterium]